MPDTEEGAGRMIRRPVIRLYSGPNGTGELVKVLTRINPEKTDSSIMTYPRPGWPAFHSDLTDPTKCAHIHHVMDKCVDYLGMQTSSGCLTPWADR
jgi:hypothetical protein